MRVARGASPSRFDTRAEVEDTFAIGDVVRVALPDVLEVLTLELILELDTTALVETALDALLDDTSFELEIEAVSFDELESSEPDAKVDDEAALDVTFGVLSGTGTSVVFAGSAYHHCLGWSDLGDVRIQYHRSDNLFLTFSRVELTEMFPVPTVRSGKSAHRFAGTDRG